MQHAQDRDLVARRGVERQHERPLERCKRELVGPQRALVITFVNPAVAVLLGVLLLDEPFTLGIAVGLPVVLAGCVLATRRSAPREPAAVSPG